MMLHGIKAGRLKSQYNFNIGKNELKINNLSNNFLIKPFKESQPVI